jgi:predicted outer membrane protein
VPRKTPQPAEIVEQSTTERDEQVLNLRQQGRSFTKIARELQFDGVREIVAAYSRAVTSRKSAKERTALRKAELKRLDGLEQHTRANERFTETDIAKRVRVIDSLRSILAA